MGDFILPVDDPGYEGISYQGSVSVMGLMNDTEHRVKLLIDEDVLSSEYVGCHPCINTSSIRFRTSDLVEKILPAMEHDFIKVKL